MKIHKENRDRWIGKSEYNCLTCSHSMSTEDNRLICVEKPAHKEVEELNLCEEWV